MYRSNSGVCIATIAFSVFADLVDHLITESCERISAKDLDEMRFMRDFVLPQRPVVITDVTVMSRLESTQFLGTIFIPAS